MITDVIPMPARPSLVSFEQEVQDLIAGVAGGRAEAVQFARKYHPIRRERLRDDALRTEFSPEDARLVVATAYGFATWEALAEHIEGVGQPDSAVARFEAAADAVVAGDVTLLGTLLDRTPELVRMRSTRVHQCTLLHYVGANGVEQFRQKSPPNAVAVARLLLRAGAEVDAVTAVHNETPLLLVASSIHPVEAGVQIPLIDVLLEAGAALDGKIVNVCLANGRGEAAAYLATRGAPLDLEGASGVGRLDLVQGFFDPDGRLRAGARQAQMEAGFAWACEYGHGEVVEFLLRMGIPADARLPHSGQTGLHWAAYGAHPNVVRLLLARNAPLDVREGGFGGTPLDWALHGWQEPPHCTARSAYYEVVAELVAAGATVTAEQLVGPQVRDDARMVAALAGGGPG